MDVFTEQVYQQRIAELEVLVVDLRSQLAQRDITIAALQQQVAELSKQVAELLAEVARLSKNSSNSSKPPSSDIVKPPPPPLPPGEKRSIGGQKGHPRHEREPFTSAQINRIVDYKMDRCPDCGGRVRPLKQPPRKLQQAEIPEVPVEVVEHRRHRYFLHIVKKSITHRSHRKFRIAGWLAHVSRLGSHTSRDPAIVHFPQSASSAAMSCSCRSHGANWPR